MGLPLAPPIKTPQPVDFTPEPIPNNNTDSNPELKDKFHIKVNTFPTAPTTMNGTQNIPPNLFKLVETSAGINLIPLQMITTESMKVMTLEPLNVNAPNAKNTPQIGVQTNTVNCNVAPITSAVEMINDDVRSRSIAKKTLIVEDQNHCKCCVIMRRYFKRKQKKITDYFGSNKERSETCRCINRNYPRVTNRLRLLVNRFTRRFDVIYKDLKQRLQLMEEMDDTERQREISYLDSNQEDDFGKHL